MLKRAKGFRPDVVMLSCTTYSYQWMIEVSIWLKNELGVPVIAGGNHATIIPEKVIANPSIDYVCVGEGDLAVIDLVEAIEGNCDDLHVKNIWVKHEGEIIQNEVRELIPDLDSLPFPDKDIFYQYGCFRSNAYIMTSRGCPFSCTFCENNYRKKLYHNKGPHVRRHSVDYTIALLKYYKKRYNLRSIHFYDDIFTSDLDWLVMFAGRYRREVDLPFYCLTSCRYIDDDVASILSDAGCRCVGIGIESGNSYIRNEILHKGLSDETIYNAFAALKKSRIRVVAFNIFGVPMETDRHMWETLEMNLCLRPKSLFSFVFYPYPALDLTEMARNEGMIDDHAWNKILEGCGSSQETPLIKHPFGDAALNFKVAAPILNKLPRWVAVVLRGWLSHRHSSLLLRCIQLLSTVFLSWWEVSRRFEEQVSILVNFAAARGEKYRTRRALEKLSGRLGRD